MFLWYMACWNMAEDAPPGPLWTQDQAIVYEAALEAINDVIAGYSEQIANEHDRPRPDTSLLEWLEMRTDQAIAAREALNVTDTHVVYQALREFGGIVRNRDIRG